MADIIKLIEAGKALNLEGQELQSFVNLREEREARLQAEEREARRQAEDKAIERDERAAERELQKLTLQTEKAQAELETERVRSENSATPKTDNPSYRLPKIPVYNAAVDEMDPYLHRFEMYANNMNWSRQEMAGGLANLLTGQALNVLQGLTIEDAKNYSKIKEALLKRFQYTADGFRDRFRQCRPEQSENFDTFVNRMTKYLDRWIELADAKDYPKLINLMMIDQIYTVCHPDLVAFIKERKPVDITTLKVLAEQYKAAHPEKNLAKTEDEKPAFSFTAANINDQRDGRTQYKKQFTTQDSYRSKSATMHPQYTKRQERYDRESPERGTRPKRDTTEQRYYCQTCKKSGHSTARCFKNNRPTQNISCQICFKSGHKADRCFKYTRKTNHFANLVYDTKSNKSAVANTSNIADFTGSLKFHTGRVNGKLCTILRDTGNNSIGCREALVNPDDITDKSVDCLVYGGRTERFRVAKIYIETPFYTGEIYAHVLPDSVADLVIGNIIGLSEEPHEMKTVKHANEDKPDEIAYPAITRAESKRRKEDSPEETQKNASIPHEQAVIDIDEPTINQTNAGSDRSEVRFNHEYMRKAQNTDPELAKLIKHRDSNHIIDNGILYREVNIKGQRHRQMVVPLTYRREILKLGHDSIHAGHLGIASTKKRVMKHFSWKGITKDISEYVKSCDICQRKMSKGRNPKIPLQEMEIIENPFEKISIDIIGPFPLTKQNNRYILTVVDAATRWPEAIPLTKITTEHVVDALMSIFSRLGIPKVMLSDNAQQFVSHLMTEVMQIIGVEQTHSAPYHPQSNGMCERFNGTLKSMLRKLSGDRPTDWDKHIPQLLFAYREIPHSTTGFSPFAMMYGRQPRGPLAVIKDLCAGTETNGQSFMFAYDYAKQLAQRISDTCKIAKENTAESVAKHKKYADQNSKLRKFLKGDLVLALLPNESNTLTMAYKGPFRVEGTQGETNYHIRIGKTLKTYHANILKKYNTRNVTTSQANTVFQVANIATIVDESDAIGSENMPEILYNQQHQTEDYTHIEINENNRTSQEISKIRTVLASFADVFTDVPGRTDCIEHDIRLTSEVPVKLKPYTIPLHAKQKVIEELQTMLDLGIVRQSDSPYSSPIVIVKKKDGNIRLCIDFRKLNSITVFDAEPIPNQDELMAKLCSAKYYSKIDLSKGYFQIPLKEDCKKYTAFQSPIGLLEYNFLPFGCSTAASTFQRMMRKILKDIPNVVSYFDDILIHGETWEQHDCALKETLRILRQHGLTARPTKTNIGFEEIEFLGHKVGNGKQRPEESKIEKVKALKPPTAKREVRKVLGLLNYYRKFVKNFSSIALPLTELTKKGQPNKVKWTEACNTSFNTIKRLLSEEPILILPNIDKPFTIRTDASDYGISGVLLQNVDGQLRPCAYISRKLLDRERRYSVIEKECLAVVFTVGAFEKYLLFKHFTIETDHKPLSFMKQNKAKNNRLMRWALSLQQFMFTINPIPGNHNLDADLLSRLL